MTLLAAGGYPWWAFDLPFWSCVVFVLMIATLLVVARKPLATGMKNRQLQIINELRRAESIQRDVEQLRERHDREREQFERDIDAMLAEGRRDAAVFAERLVERARAEADRIKQRSQREIGLSRQKVMQELWQLTADLSSGAAEKVLSVDLSSDDHRRLIDGALQEIAQFHGSAL